jgi:multidrug resistance efflux pump
MSGNGSPFARWSKPPRSRLPLIFAALVAVAGVGYWWWMR